MRLIKGSLASLGLVAVMAAAGLGVGPVRAQSDDFPGVSDRPGANIPPGPVPGSSAVEPVAPSAPAAASEHATSPGKLAPVAPAASAPKKTAAPSQRKKEVLPWENAPKVLGAPAAPGADSAALEAAAAQCGGLFEAACRDLKTCAWIADVTLGDGTTSPARCVARPPAPPKKTAKKTPAPAKPKKADAVHVAPDVPAAKLPDAAPAATSPDEPEKKSELAPEPESAPSKATEPEPQKASQKASESQKAAEPEKTAERKGPIVVTSPSPPPAAEHESGQGPSFGSGFGGTVGGSNEVVVTVPSPH